MSILLKARQPDPEPRPDPEPQPHSRKEKIDTIVNFLSSRARIFGDTEEPFKTAINLAEKESNTERRVDILIDAMIMVIGKVADAEQKAAREDMEEIVDDSSADLRSESD